MGMETMSELSKPPKKSDFEDQISLGYVGRRFGIFRVGFNFFLAFGRVLFILKHETIIMKDKSDIYLEGYNGKSDHVLLSSRG